MSHTHENRDDKVSLVEMGPRDGLQNETATLSLAQRLAWCPICRVCRPPSPHAPTR